MDVKFELETIELVNPIFGIIGKRRLRNVECTFYFCWAHLTDSVHETVL